MVTVKADIAELKSGMITANKNIDELKTGMITANENIDELKTGMITANENIDELKTGMITANKNIGDLKGHAIPGSAQNMLGEIAQILNVRKPRWLEKHQLIDISDDAQDDGKADIPSNEMQSFRRIDLAMTAVDKETREACYVVIECSYTVDQHDVTRAKRNAEHMTRFTGAPAKAMVAGDSIPEPVSEFAKEQGVACLTVTTKSAAPR